MFRLSLIALILMAGMANAGEIKGRVLLDDGDTPMFQIRMFGVDTPEKTQHCRDAAGACYKCGEEATRFLASIMKYRFGSKYLSQEEMRCEFVPGQYTYGRMVGVCYHGETNLGVEIVRAGWGIAYRQYLDQVPELKQAFLDAEAEAKAAKRGVWQGEFVEPAEWRRGARIGC